MTEATYVSFVPRRQRAKLRSVLETQGAGEVVWRERKGLFRSEFYFSGPSAVVRKTHDFITRWLADDALFT